MAGNAAAVAAIGLPAWAGWAARRGRERAHLYAIDVQSRFAVVVGRAIAPIAGQLAKVMQCTCESEKNRLKGELRGAIMNAALALTVPDARVLYYTYSSAAGGPSRLVRDGSAYGRQDQGRTCFARGADVRANAALDLVERCGIELVEDVEAPAYVSAYIGKEYRTFIAATVSAGTTPLGLLTIDSPVADSLDHTHKGVMEVLASLMAVAVIA